MEDKNYIFSQYQHISNKLKKRRILKKPNVTEASQQFENLAAVCENEELPHYAAFCYQAAANCQNSLGNSTEQAFLLLKASRQYMSSYLRLVKHKMVYTDENYHNAMVCYKECMDCYAASQDSNIPDVNVILASISMEMGDTLKDKLGNVELAVEEYKKSLKFVEKSPMEKINCLQKLVSSKIKLGDHGEALQFANDLVEELEKIPASGFREDTTRSSEITRVFLLLILQPTPQQISPWAASILEKYAWVETVDNNEMADLQSTLRENGLSALSEKLFLCLQSLVMACQYGDKDCLVTLENELLPYLNCDQKDLLRILVKQKLKK